MLELQIKERDTKASPDALRAEGLVPAVFYGRKEESTPISINAVEFGRILSDAGETTIVNLSGVGDKKEVLIHAVDVHPVSGVVQHVDFYAIERGKLLEVSIPLEFEGEAPAEKKGGVVVKVLHELPIKVRPSELPQHFTIDLSKLEEIGDHITAGDLELPPSATLEVDPQDTIVSVTEAKEEATEEPAAVEGGNAESEGSSDGDSADGGKKAEE